MIRPPGDGLSIGLAEQRLMLLRKDRCTVLGIQGCADTVANQAACQRTESARDDTTVATPVPNPSFWPLPGGAFGSAQPTNGQMIAVTSNNRLKRHRLTGPVGA